MGKILLTGANGLVGQSLVQRISIMPGYSLLATSASDCVIGDYDQACFMRMDITSPQEVKKVFDFYKPDIVIHCAAATQVDPCELDHDLSDTTNIEGTRLVGKAAEDCGARFIYLSTDFVFDGLHGPYREEDQPNPVNVYGWSKLQGEYITRSLKVPWAIVRTILVYGITLVLKRPNLVTRVRDSLTNGSPIRVVDDQFRMPTLVDDLSEGIAQIIQRSKTGIYHLSGPEMVSIYDFAVKIARSFQLDTSLISAIHSDLLSQPGRRPAVTGFILKKAIDELTYVPRNINDGLEVVKKSIAGFSI